MLDFKYSASRLSLIASVSTAILFTAVMIYFVSYNVKKEYAKRVVILEQRFTDDSRANIKAETERLFRRIEIIREEVAEFYMNSLISYTSSLVDIINIELKKTTSKQKINYQTLISSFERKEDLGDLFLVSTDGKILYFDNHKELVGKSIFHVFKIPESVAKSLEEPLNKSIQTYEEVNGDKSKIIYLHQTALKDVYAGSYFSAETIDKRAQKIAKKTFEKERYGVDGSGYFWAVTSGLDPVTDFTSYRPVGKNLYNIRSNDGRYVYRELKSIAEQNDGGFAEYFAPRPDSTVPEKQLVYVKEYKPWNWIIGTGFYISSLEQNLKVERNLINKFIDRNVAAVIKVIISLFVFVIVSGLVIFKMIRALEKKQAVHRNLLEQYKSILDKSAAVTITDEFGVITYVNDKFCEISGFERHELIGKRHNILKHPSTPIETFKDLWGTITTKGVWKGVLRNKRKDGSSFYISATIAPVYNEQGEILEFIGSANDITELVENKNLVEELFNTDILTGLGSRLKLINDIMPIEYPVLAVIDIKGFKQINELFGNQFADVILVETAKELVSTPSFFGYQVYRLHSDKFGILADNVDILAFKENITSAMRSISTNFQKKYGEDKRIYFTAGIASGKENILVYADMALNGAKKLKQELLIYSQADNNMLAEFEENLSIIKKVSDALANDMITAFYQPIVNLKTGDSEKFECLMRLIDSDGDILSPVKFLDISKKTNMYPRLTAKVIEKSVATFRRLPHQFSINLSVEDIFDKETMDYLYTVGKNNGILGRLVMEIVESQELVDIGETNRIFEKFKAAGAKISIDDFGTGFSNFEYLLNIRADFLKIDASIVKRVINDESSKEVISSIVSLAKHSGMQTVAEYIADENIAREITKLGVDFGQGYFFGKPTETPLFIHQKVLY